MTPTRQARAAWLLFALCLLYASLRYVAFAASPAPLQPAWLTNKALALASIGTWVLGLAARRQGDESAAQAHFARCGQQALGHVLLTLALLGPAAYPKLYPDGHLSATGEGTILAGAAVALALGRFGQPAYLLGGLAALMVHLLLLGARGWASPATWPGGLPPMTLIGFLAAGLAAAWTVPGMRRRPTP